MLSYARDDVTWRDYQPHFPAEFRLTESTLPTESWWTFRDLSLHIDRYEHGHHARSVILCHGAGGYGRLLAPLGRFLYDRGYNVVMPDMPGYGLSKIAPKQMRCPLWVEATAELAM